MMLDKEFWLKASILLFIIGVVFVTGCIQESNVGNLSKNVSKTEIEQNNVSLEPLSYPLPLNLAEIENYEKIQSVFNLTDSQIDLLKKNGFVVLDWRPLEQRRRERYPNDSIAVPYREMKQLNIPIFVTSDSLLHVFHVQFNEILKNFERIQFFNDLNEISKVMEIAFINEYNNADGELKEAAKRNVEYFAVGLRLLDSNASIPEFARVNVEKELKLINDHEDFDESPIFRYKEDYSQYVPRGHYTSSEELRKYFKAMMWYGRMAFLLKEGLVSKEDAKIQTIQASLISIKMDSMKTSDNKTVAEKWSQIYNITSLFVGFADDLTPYEYRECLRKVFGITFKQTELTQTVKLLNLKAELAKLRAPKIYGGTGECVLEPPITEEKVNECFEKSKGMRFMGQKFIPDSYMFQSLVGQKYSGNSTPFTLAGPIRGFPRGLDIMAVLGSKQAINILEKEGDTEYEGYNKNFKDLREEFDGLNESEWNKNLYWSWLYTLKPLLNEYGSEYPTFMQTQAWQDKELNTALASWTELRHDTILYSKQSYIITAVPPPEKPLVGYVEPEPEFYARLLSLTKMTMNATQNLKSTSDNSKLYSLYSIFSRLHNISKKELENKELSEDDYSFINLLGDSLSIMMYHIEEDDMRTTMVADVHTEVNSGMVLEEGTGGIDLILVAYKVPDGRIIIGAGPIIPYYEFKHPMDDRLTDEKWREMLKKNPPDDPKWTGSFRVKENAPGFI